MSNISKKLIRRYSNPTEVYRRAKKYLGKTVKIGLSTKKEKKYMVTTPHGNIVHFGQMGYEDWTRHQDVKRREAFRIRNKQWAKADKWTAAYLAYYLLW